MNHELFLGNAREAFDSEMRLANESAKLAAEQAPPKSGELGCETRSNPHKNRQGRRETQSDAPPAAEL